VEYTAAGQTGSADTVQTIRFQNRNAMTWDDDRRAAAFVTKNADPVKQFVGSTVAAAALTSTSPLDKNLLVAIAIHEALAQYGITYWTDPAASYETVTASKTAVDQLRFPEETLRFKIGDCDDLSILTCALLEAAAVEAAFITIPGHIYAAFALKMTPEEARKGFLKPDQLVFKVDKAWVPVEVTNIKGGFLKAWEDGAKEWLEYDSRGQAVLYPLADAWKLYAPTDYSAGALTLAMPADAAIAKAYTDEVRKFIDQETATRVAALQADVTKNPGKPAYQNKLGVLYARYGLNTEAEQQFAAATKVSDYAPALLNLGNLAFLKSDTRKALEYYERARKADAANPRAILGVARSNHALENYGTSKEAYDALKGIDAALAAQFSYLTLRGPEATRAADAGQVKGTVFWDEP
jgi:tetratricopeptide (TPR) repeat protein